MFIGAFVFCSSMAPYFAARGFQDQWWNTLADLTGVFLFLAVPVALFLGGTGAQSDGEYSRLAGLYAPTSFAAFGGLVMLWSMARLCRAPCSQRAWLFALTGLVTLALTLTRAAWGLTAFWCILCLAARRGFIRTSLELGVALSVIVFAHFNELVPGERQIVSLASRGQGGDALASLDGRIPLYIYLLENEFARHPLFGEGFEMMTDEDAGTRDAASRSEMAAAIGFAPTAAHSLALELLVGTGIVGFALFGIGTVQLVRDLLHNAKLGSKASREACYLLGFILSYSMVDTFLLTGVDPFFLVFSIAAGLSGSRSAAPSALETRVKSVWASGGRPK
jgi:O-antigen ligase